MNDESKGYNDQTTDAGAVEGDGVATDAGGDVGNVTEAVTEPLESSDGESKPNPALHDAPATDAGGPLGNVTEAVTEPVANESEVVVNPAVPGNEERASRLSTPDEAATTLNEDRYRSSSDEPYKDHGNRHEGPSSKHSTDDVTESKIAGPVTEEVAPGVVGSSSGQHTGVQAAETGTGSNTTPS